MLLVQRADGGLTIGDTHEYAEPFGFDLDEDAYDHLRARAETLLGAPIPPVRRRWAGRLQRDGPRGGGHALYHRAEVEPGVILVTGPGGRGMTCSPAIAEETFAMTRITVACLDMAGTTVADDGTVLEAFAAAVAGPARAPPSSRR